MLLGEFVTDGEWEYDSLTDGNAECSFDGSKVGVELGASDGILEIDGIMECAILGN